jgi:IS66 Orf2 like protein
MHYVTCPADRVKLLVYDDTGLVLIWKRMEGAKFKWPAISLTWPIGCRVPEFSHGK